MDCFSVINFFLFCCFKSGQRGDRVEVKCVKRGGNVKKGGQGRGEVCQGGIM